jgi:hypothetical protein
MTEMGTHIAALLAAGAVTAGGLLGGEPAATPGLAPPTALVIDAAAARDGRDLVDPRLRAVDAEIRLPRTPAEARTNVRYFAALDYRVVVAGPQANAAAADADVAAVRAPDLTTGLAAVTR